MPRLPIPGDDAGNWGEILNNFLLQTHTSSGEIKPGSIQPDHLASSVQTSLSDGQQKVSKTGDDMQGDLTLDGSSSHPRKLELLSSDSGGENTFDSTSRINLHTYQRAQKRAADNTTPAHFGEVIRIDLETSKAKGVIAIRENYTGSGLGPRSVAWLVAHGESNDSTPQNPIWHNHFSIEIPDELGQLQSALEFPYAPFNQPNGYGHPIADHYVRSIRKFIAANDIRLEGSNAENKNIYFASKTYNDETGKRWGVQVDNSSESGSNLGSDFRINRYTDSGSYLETALFVRRQNGQMGVGGVTNPQAKLDITSLGSYPTLQASLTTSGTSIYPVYSSKIVSPTNKHAEFSTSGDTSPKLRIKGDAALEWGDGSSEPDTNLYRSAAGTLRTDGDLIVAGSIQAPSMVVGQFIRKQSDQTINNQSTLQDDADPILPVLPNSVYIVEGQFFYSTSSTADLKIGFSAPTGSLLDWTTHSLDSSAGSGTTAVKLTAQTIFGSPSYGGIGVGVRASGFAKGVLATGSTGGNLVLRWSQFVQEASDSVLYANSYIRLTKMS